MATEVGERIKEASKAVGGLNQLAVRVPIARRTLGDKIAGKTQPEMELIVRIAQVTGYSVDYIARGRGPKKMRDAPTSASRLAETAQEKFVPELDSPAHVDITSGLIHPDVLADIYDVVRQVYEAAGVRLPRKIEMQMVGMLYNGMIRRGIDLLNPADIQARLDEMRHEIESELRDAASDPGSGKRSA